MIMNIILIFVLVVLALLLFCWEMGWIKIVSKEKD
jgi:hypothetical protein